MCDGTRAQPRDKMIPAVLDELGVPDEDVVILVATGTHRGNTDEEIRAMLGDDVVERVRVVNHDARDKRTLGLPRRARQRRPGVDQPRVGRGRPAHHDRLRRAALLRRLQRRAEARHPRAGRASTPSWCCTTPPGSAIRNATWGVIEGNPVHEDIRAACAAAPPHFTFDVILNREQRVIEAFAGELGPMHAAACEAARAFAMQAGARAVRRRRHQQLRLSARPEPLPGGQGHVRGRQGRQARRADRLRRRVPRRLPRPRLLPPAARGQPGPARVPAPDRASPTTSRRTSGRSRSRPTSRTTRAS